MKKQTKEKIKEEMTLSEVVLKYPETAKVFMKYRMHCIGCSMAMQETIEEGARAHGINTKKLINEINKVIG